MNHVSDLKTGEADFPDALHLVAEFIGFKSLLGTDVRKDTVPLALPNVEGLAVSRIDESVHVRPQLLCNVRGEPIARLLVHWNPIS